MKRCAVILLLLTFAGSADAQVRRRVPRVPEPSTWLSLSVGLFNANNVSDGATNSTWDFGQSSTPQFRASLEKAINNNASIGATGTYAHVPFVYRGPETGVLNPPNCSRCDAHLDVVSLGASFHYGGGMGLHQVLEGSAGALQYRNLKRDSDGAALAPVSGNIDPYFTFGYGFGYTFNPALEISVVQDLGLALHERTGLTSDQSNTLRHRTTRVNFRYGFGSRIRRR
ncbi:MAG: hypothetical protein ABI681_08435 [Gemmatimonadales bacterium]